MRHGPSGQSEAWHQNTRSSARCGRTCSRHEVIVQRNLIYTGITRGKRLLVLIGQKKALAIAVRNDRPQRRYSGLLATMRGNEQRG